LIQEYRVKGPSRVDFSFKFFYLVTTKSLEILLEVEMPKANQAQN